MGWWVAFGYKYFTPAVGFEFDGGKRLIVSSLWIRLIGLSCREPGGSVVVAGVVSRAPGR